MGRSPGLERPALDELSEGRSTEVADGPLRIGQAARLAGVNVQTLRFYERLGLLPVPERRPSGFREYSPEVVRVVRFICRAKELGFTLKEVGELLALREVPTATCGDILALAERKREEIRAKIRDLRAMQAALTKLIEDCPGGKVPVIRCPIIDALARGARPDRE